MVDRGTLRENEDLLLAAELQAALLPKECPSGSPHYEAAARNRMCGTVGGDFYDFIQLNDDQIALVIGDVVGHGVSAALLMANIMGFLRSDLVNRTKPHRVVAELNDLLLELNDKTGSIMLCSLLYTVIDGPTGCGFFANAGHPRPILCDADRCSASPMGSCNMLLGVEPFDPHEQCHTFTSGQRMTLYTDGITDAANAAGLRFGNDRLHDIIAGNSKSRPQQLADAVFDEVQIFRGGAEQTDDESIVVFDRV